MSHPIAVSDCHHVPSMLDPLAARTRAPPVAPSARPCAGTARSPFCPRGAHTYKRIPPVLFVYSTTTTNSFLDGKHIRYFLQSSQPLSTATLSALPFIWTGPRRHPWCGGAHATKIRAFGPPISPRAVVVQPWPLLHGERCRRPVSFPRIDIHAVPHSLSCVGARCEPPPIIVALVTFKPALISASSTAHWR
jgi:hypothetical protein